MSKPTRGRPPEKSSNRSASSGRRPPAQGGARSPSQSREEARRAQIARRKKAIRRRKLVFSFALLLVVAAVGIILSLTVFFKIDTIEVKGSSRYKKEEVVNACGIQKEQNLFLANLQDAEAALQAKLPYIYSVKISRVLPGTLRVEVTDGQAAYAVARENKKYTLLDDRCKVLQLDVDSPPTAAAILKGVTLSASVPGSTAVFKQDYAQETLAKISKALQEEGFKDVTSIDLTSRSQLWATYQNRIRLQLGGDTDLGYKFRFAKKSIERLDETTPGAKGSLNLTVKKNAYWMEDTAAK